MKKTITLLAVCLFTVLTAQAQATFKPGIRAGVNFATITQSDFDTKTDFYVGGLFAMKLSRFYTMQPEITYSRQGATGSIVYYDPNLDAEVKKNGDVNINYLSFSLMSKFTFSDSFDIHVGPMLDFEAGSNVRTNIDLDMGIMAGVGYTFPFGLTLEARVKKGIIDVLESDGYYGEDGYFFVDDYNTNFVFQVGGSYSFDIKGREK